jgi:hypothetical protein
MCYMIRDSETHGRVKVVYLLCISGTVGRWDTALDYIPIYVFTNLSLLRWENTTSGFPRYDLSNIEPNFRDTQYL